MEHDRNSRKKIQGFIETAPLQQTVVIPVGGQPARTLKQTFPANSFDIEISDKQKIESLIWSIMRDHLVISKSWLKGCVIDARIHHESKEGYLGCADSSSQIECDFTVINSDSFIFSHLTVSHQKQPRCLSEKSQFLAWDVPSCQPASACARLHMMCLCLLCCSGGDWNSLCEMIFEVIKESHSVKLTVLMESRNRSSSPNSQTGLLTATGGAQKHSKCQERYVLWFNLQRRCLLSCLCCMRDRKIATEWWKQSKYRAFKSYLAQEALEILVVYQHTAHGHTQFAKKKMLVFNHLLLFHLLYQLLLHCSHSTNSMF